jgi:hypothetical protein
LYPRYSEIGVANPFHIFKMLIYLELSSQRGERMLTGNEKVARQCISEPKLLEQIVVGINDDDLGVAGDCADVLSKIAVLQPALIKSYAVLLADLLRHEVARLRWEAMQTLAMLSKPYPEILEPHHAFVGELLRHDTSAIVRDNALYAIWYLLSPILRQNPGRP